LKCSTVTDTQKRVLRISRRGNSIALGMRTLTLVCKVALRSFALIDGVDFGIVYQ